MNLRQRLDPETMNMFTIKLEMQQLKYNELLNRAVGQQLLIDDYEKFHIDKLKSIDVQTQLIESMEFYLERNVIVDKDILLKDLEELKKLL